MFGPAQAVVDILVTIFLTPPLAFFVWGIIGFVVGLWFVLKYYRPKPEDYRLERFSEVINNDLEKSLNTLGVRAENTKLLKGLVKIGDVAKMIHERGIITITPDSQNETNNEDGLFFSESSGTKQAVVEKVKVKGKLEHKTKFDIYVFEVNVGDSFLNIFGKGNERFVIDAEFITYDPVRNVYQVNDNVNFFSYGEVWVTSGVGKHYLNDIAWKRFAEHHVEETMNIPKKTAYLEMRHSKRIDMMEKATELEQSKYRQYKRQALLEEEQ